MSRRLTTEEWIRRSIEFHGEKYDYSKSIYTRGDEKIIIICPDHGEQLQRAESHWKYGPRCCSGSRFHLQKYPMQVNLSRRLGGNMGKNMIILMSIMSIHILM